MAIAALVAGASLAGMTDARYGWTFTAMAVISVAVTVGAGPTYGLYLGLTIVAVGGMVSGGGPTTAELGALGATIVVVHELVRFSLDTRAPTRFGRGVVVRYLTRTAVVALASPGLAFAVDRWFERAPTGALWIPIAVVAAGSPLFGLVGAERGLTYRPFESPAVRTLAAVTAVVALAAIVVVGAQARSALVPTGPATDDGPVASPPTTQPAEAVEPEPGEPLSRLAVGIVVLVIGIVLYLMLRKPEADFQLEEIEQPAESREFDLGVAGLADSEADAVASSIIERGIDSPSVLGSSGR
jgi:hypothetical protein